MSKDFDAIWQTRGGEHLLEADPGETLRSRLTTSPEYILPAIDLGDPRAPLFRVSTPLGQGGMGVVYRASQAGIRREVALKTIHEGAQEDAHANQALLREAQVMAALDHPNIVPVHIIAQTNEGRPFVAMKYVDGLPLNELIEPNVGAKDFGKFLDALIAVCHGLRYVHSRGVLHLDIKPANIMVGHWGEAFLMDWGTATAFREDAEIDLPLGVSSERIVGTPAYVAPEMVAADSSVGPYSDVYMLGGLLYEALCGKPPHHGKTVYEVIECSFYGRIAPLPDHIPEDLRQLCTSALARDFKKRIPSVDAFLEGLVEHRNRRFGQDLLRKALAQLRDLEASTQSEEADRSGVYRRFGAARATFEQLKDVLAGNSTVRQGIQSTLQAMIEYELKTDHPSAARSLYEELAEPVPQLRQRIDAALEDQSQRLAKARELEKLRRDLDPMSASKTKAALWFAIGLAIAATQLLPEYLQLISRSASTP